MQRPVRQKIPEFSFRVSPDRRRLPWRWRGGLTTARVRHWAHAAPHGQRAPRNGQHGLGSLADERPGPGCGDLYARVSGSDFPPGVVEDRAECQRLRVQLFESACRVHALLVEGVDGSGNVVNKTTTLVFDVPPNNRAFFHVSVPDAPSQPVLVLSFHWVQDLPSYRQRRKANVVPT